MRSAAAALETCRGRRSGSAGPGRGRGARRAAGSMPRCPCFPGSSRIPPFGRSLEPRTGISAPDCPNAILVRWSRTNQELCLDICSRDFNSTGRAPGRCFGAEEEERTFPGLGARQGNGLQPGEAFARISRKLNKSPAAAPHRSVLLRQIPAGSSPGRAGTGQGPGRDRGAEPESPVLLQFGQWGLSRERLAGAPVLQLHPSLSFWDLLIFLKLRFNFNFIYFGVLPVLGCYRDPSATGLSPYQPGHHPPPPPHSAAAPGSPPAHGGRFGSPPRTGIRPWAPGELTGERPSPGLPVAGGCGGGGDLPTVAELRVGHSGSGGQELRRSRVPHGTAAGRKARNREAL